MILNPAFVKRFLFLSLLTLTLCVSPSYLTLPHMNQLKGDPRSIGVFDSGIGGLTVASSIRSILPGEDIVYLGDLLHLPYGSKSPRAVLEFTRAAVGFLVGRRVKLIVIACNTATSIAMEQVEKEVDVPVVGVIKPGAVASCAVSKNKRIGVIGTTRTIESDAYKTAIGAIDPGVQVFQRATPLLVPLIEEGWLGHPVLELVLSEYLNAFRETMIDTIVLGCTHYPIIKNEISRLLEGIAVVDSARTTAENTKSLLSGHGALNGRKGGGATSIHLTDHTDAFDAIGRMIVGKEEFNAQVVNLSYSQGKVTYS
jgi:glutamate racemase